MVAPASVIFSLQSKLILAFVVVVLVALVLAASIFVFVRRGELEEQELDQVFASSPVLFAYFSRLQEQRVPDELMAEFVHEAANVFDVRMLLVERSGGTVVVDSGEELDGQFLSLPDDLTAPPRLGSSAHVPPYTRWEPRDGAPGSDLILVSAGPIRQLQRFGGARTDGYWLVLAVPKATIADAWQGIVGGLAVAAAIALAVAVLLAVVVSRYITRPLEQLTLASQRVAEGSFDVEVSVERRDEVGRLAQAFSIMVSRVGDANSQMRVLVANVSHDLKTPLTSILGFAQALRDGSATDEADARRMGAVIHEEASRLTARLNDLLYLSELESGQALLQRDEIDVRRLIEDAVRRIEAEVSARDVRLAVDLADGIVVSADGQKLERAIENLLDNAGKYTPAGGEIRVRSSVVEDGRIARIEVANTVADMSADELPRLFERFYRRDRDRSGGGDAGGSGLGLPIARDLIQLHEGTLDAVAADGEIVFVIRLPLQP